MHAGDGKTYHSMFVQRSGSKFSVSVWGNDGCRGSADKTFPPCEQGMCYAADWDFVTMTGKHPMKSAQFDSA